MPDNYTDEDLDRIEKEPHRHQYNETLDTGYRYIPTGIRYRIFRCKTCGKIRSVPIRVEAGPVVLPK